MSAFNPLKRNQVNRRTFLRGAGAVMSLPLLETMISPAAAAGKSEEKNALTPVRMAWTFFPNGTIPGEWLPTDSGRDWKITPSLEPLAPFKKEITAYTGLAQHNAYSLGDGPGDHARCASTYLTGMHPVKTAGANIRVGKSIDQVAADYLGRVTRLPSLVLGAEAGRNAGSCDSGYSCAYSNNISWRTATEPAGKEINPRLAFERLFGTGIDGHQRKKRMFYRKSILDMVSDDAAHLKKQLGRTDRRKLNEYFASVRQVEQRIEKLRSSPPKPPADFTMPEGIPEVTSEHVRLMFDVIILAFQTDATRVASYMIANAGSNRSYPEIGVNNGHHALSHHRNDPEKMRKIAKIDKFLVSEFAYFLKRMKETPDGEGTLLDHSLLVYGSAIGSGNRHNHNELPIIMAGGGRGQFKTGLHIHYDEDTPLNNLYVSMLGSAGVNIKSFGDATGTLKEALV